MAAALSADDQGLARIAAVHLRLPDLPDHAARDAMEAIDVLLKYARDEGGGDWNPALHPRAGTPPNPGWFAPAEGADDGISSIRTAGGAVSENVQLADADESTRPGHEPDLLGGGGGGGYTGGRPVPVLQGGRLNLESILAPGGNLIGNPGTNADVRTVSPAEFEALRSDLLSGAIPMSGPRSYDGMVFERPDGSLIGIRESEKYGTTIDVLKSTSRAIENGFRIHQR